jgi:hypothetical protein
MLRLRPSNGSSTRLAETWTFSPAYLASRAPAVGGSFNDTRTYSNGDASYTMTVVVTRVG